MTNACFFIGAPIEFENTCLIYPPKVQDVVANTHFGQYSQILTMSQEDLEDEFHDKLGEGQHVPSPLEFLLANCYQNDTYRNLTKQAFRLFTKQEISFFFDQKTIIFGDIQKLVAEGVSLDNIGKITEENYFKFQNLIREAIGAKILTPPDARDPNEDPRVTRIKMMARYRDRMKAKHGTKNGISLDTCLTALCCMGIGITPMNIGEMSYVAVNSIMRTFQEREKYDIDIKSLLAGASSKKIKPQYWIRNLKD